MEKPSETTNRILSDHNEAGLVGSVLKALKFVAEKHTRRFRRRHRLPCGEGGKPAPPIKKLAEVIVGPQDQGIAAGEYEEALPAIGHTLVSIQTSFPKGEIRGQIWSVSLVWSSERPAGEQLKREDLLFSWQSFGGRAWTLETEHVRLRPSAAKFFSVAPDLCVLLRSQSLVLFLFLDMFDLA